MDMYAEEKLMRTIYLARKRQAEKLAMLEEKHGISLREFMDGYEEALDDICRAFGLVYESVIDPQAWEDAGEEVPE